MTNEADHNRDEEAIVAIKPTFRASASEAKKARREARPPFIERTGTPLLIAGAVVLLGLVVFVFGVLPGWLEDRATVEEFAAAAEPALAAEPAEPELSPEELAALQEQAESLLAELLEQRQGLTERSAARWGAEVWTAYEALGREADKALLAKDYGDAVERYMAAMAAGSALIERAGQMVMSALATAEGALAAGHAQLAREQYDIVLGAEPQNATALAGRARAERLPEVLDLVQRAEELRQQQSFEEAAALYREAIALDAAWQPARAALAETTAALASQRLEAHLSSGFAALAAEDYAEAKKHFEAALALAPRSESAVEGLAQAEQGEKLETIELAEARAMAFERREMWPEAIAVYETALGADPSLEFAQAGLERSRARSDLDIKLENLLANPNLLLTDTVLTDASRLLAEASALATPDSRLAGQVERLGELVRIASTPLTIALASDGLTEVTVYRVGALGVFATKELQIRPGTYTAVGSRDGYRDVRETFTVLPGREIPTIHIACSEPIR